MATRSRVPIGNTRRADGTRQCGAPKRDGTPCPTTRGLDASTGRCRMHLGGGKLRGAANPNFKTGRYSKDLPTRLLGRFEEAIQDAELLSIRDDVALLQGIIGAKIAELKEAEASPDLERIVGMVETIQAEWAGWDFTRMERELGTLQEAITGKSAQDRVLKEVRELVREKAVLAAQESRRLAELQQNIPIEQALLLAQALVGIVRDDLADLPDANDRLRGIAGKFRVLMTKRELPSGA